MLKEELAIQNLTALRKFFDQDISDHITINVLSKNKKYFIENVETAIKAVEKQIPKDAIVFWDEEYPEDVDAKCPSCSEFWDAVESHPKYCPYCGQKLRWAEDDE